MVDSYLHRTELCSFVCCDHFSYHNLADLLHDLRERLVGVLVVEEVGQFRDALRVRLRGERPARLLDHVGADGREVGDLAWKKKKKKK